MEELKKFQSSTFDTIARRRLVEDQDTILELTGRVQDLQNEINCMSDSKEFQDAESVRSGSSHVTSRPVSFPPHPIPEGMLSRCFGMPSRREGPPSIWDTHGISGNVFVTSWILGQSTKMETSKNDCQTPRRTLDKTHLPLEPSCGGAYISHMYTPSVSHAHFSDTFFLPWRAAIACTRGSRRLQCACHICPSHLLHSHGPSAGFAVPARSLRDHIPVCTASAGLHPIRKRGSSALPHERRGVWLPGRSHALHTVWPILACCGSWQGLISLECKVEEVEVGRAEG